MLKYWILPKNCLAIDNGSIAPHKSFYTACTLNSGKTVLKGKLNIRNGSLIVENLQIH